MLIIVNPYATTVSARLKNLVVYALRGRYDVQAIDTDAPGHATVLCREAVDEGYDVVVAFGGDGTVNEVANGLRGSQTPLTCLPGGATNVFCRTLGIPADVVDATEHLLRLADGYNPQRVDLGVVNGRAFVFASGIGLDASVVERVDQHPRAQGTARRVLLHLGGDRHLQPALPGESAAPYGRGGRAGRRGRHGGGPELGPLHLLRPPSHPCMRRRRTRQRHAWLLTVLKKAGVAQMPTLLGRVFSARAQVVQRHRQIHGDAGLRKIRVTSTDGRPLPGTGRRRLLRGLRGVEYSVDPLALSVVA